MTYMAIYNTFFSLISSFSADDTYTCTPPKNTTVLKNNIFS